MKMFNPDSANQIYEGETMRQFLACALGVAGLIAAGDGAAGTWKQPSSAGDSFWSIGTKAITLYPWWLPGPQPQPLPEIKVNYESYGSPQPGGPPIVTRDLIGPPREPVGPGQSGPFVQDGVDTINTEMTNLKLTGYLLGYQTVLQVGFDKTFFTSAPNAVGLDHSKGQIRDNVKAPVGDGRINFPDGSANDDVTNFPAESFFDLFFDIWIDFNKDGVAEVGEVLSNDVRNADRDKTPSTLSYALVMEQLELMDVPPPVRTKYVGMGAISAGDPEIGTWQQYPLNSAPPPMYIPPLADINLPYLYVITSDRQATDPRPAALLTAVTHTITPEIDAAAAPGALALLLGGLALLRERRTRCRSS